MNSILLTCRHSLIRTGIAMMLGIPVYSLAQDLPENVTLGAAGWMQYNYIGNSSAKPSISGFKEGGLDGKGVMSSGAQLSLDAVLSERLRISAGIGVVGSNSLAAGPSVKGGYAPATVDPYVHAANFTYLAMNGADSKITLRGGLFSYMYNPDVKNLGLYLLRGPVYPGIILSGFETKHVLPTANLLGLQVRHEWGAFTQDFILSSEMEFYPYFDLSPAYVANFQVHPAFRIGAGVNFHHLISVDRKLTDGYSKADRWKYVSQTGDTTYLGYDGTKVMANFSFDPKQLMDASIFGAEDLKLYGEVALLGLDNDEAHKAIYGDYSKRMPVMMGFNLPVFNYLEHLSVEFEWYGAEFEDNLDGYKVSGTEGEPKPYPTNWGTTTDKSNSATSAPAFKRDNVKWSVHGSKLVQKHVMLTFQVANDHYRPGIFDGYADSNPPRRDALLVTPKDWYSSLKLAYFF
jgi:hypothetical protein